MTGVPCVTPKMGCLRLHPQSTSGRLRRLRRHRRPRVGQRRKFSSHFYYVPLREFGILRPPVNNSSPISVRKHCEDSPDDCLAILESVHRDLAYAVAMVNANLADMTVAIAARYANFPDRIPAHLAMIAKREPCLIEIEWPVQAVQPQSSGSQPKRRRQQNEHPSPISMCERYFHRVPFGFDDPRAAAFMMLHCDRTVEEPMKRWHACIPHCIWNHSHSCCMARKQQCSSLAIRLERRSSSGLRYEPRRAVALQFYGFRHS